MLAPPNKLGMCSEKLYRVKSMKVNVKFCIAVSKIVVVNRSSNPCALSDPINLRKIIVTLVYYFRFDATTLLI